LKKRRPDLHGLEGVVAERRRRIVRADARCMKATGPRAGSPTAPPANANPVESVTDIRQTAASCMKKSSGRVQ